MKRSFSDGIALKKYHGQNFLRDHSVVLSMLTAVDIKINPFLKLVVEMDF
ncbi:MAG: hypothetical protein LVQ75_01480 [Candidatus Babeliales bacterium]|jgi:16S rRNA A1518/A1519 N6-dimethyltransferase RsmA/KsgA/DIM1 with predicted DNA glycosylase/AP lyase activity